MNTRTSSIVVFTLTALLFAGCSKEPQPSKSDIEQSLTTQLPAFARVSSFSVDAMQNMGTKVEPVWQSRFRATVKVTSATFAADGTDPGFAFVRAVKQAGDTTEVFGKSASTLYAGTWRTAFDLEGQPIQALGQPESAFAPAKVIIRGSAAETEYLRVKQERALAEQKRAEEADLYAKALARAQVARAAWTEQLAGVNAALMERHAAVEFQQVKAQAESAAGLTDKQPEQAAQQFDAATAKLKDLFAQARTKENLAQMDSALGQGNKFQVLRNLAGLEVLIPSDPRMSGLREKTAALPWPKEGSVDLGSGVAMDLVFIRSGSFTMGEENKSNQDKSRLPAYYKDLEERENPGKRQVTLTKPFYMGKYEVTQEQWQALMGSNPSNGKNKGAKNPVDGVSWDDCQQFVAKLNEKLPGLKASLPTEAQWEYACRAGSTTKFCYGDDGSGLGEYAWYMANSDNTSHPVGAKKPNAWGLYDMHGNVSEWCSDWYAVYLPNAQEDPQGPTSGGERVARGGSFYQLQSGWFSNQDSNQYSGALTSSLRGTAGPGYNSEHLGLRVVVAIRSAP